MEITRRRFMTMFELINYLQERLPIPNSEAIRIAAIMCDEDQVKVVVGISEDDPCYCSVKLSSENNQLETYDLNNFIVLIVFKINKKDNPLGNYVMTKQFSIEE